MSQHEQETGKHRREGHQAEQCDRMFRQFGFPKYLVSSDDEKIERPDGFLLGLKFRQMLCW